MLGRLRRRGVLGMNARNADFVSAFNPRALYPIVDDKLRTKQMALEAGIAVPELYGVIRAGHELRQLPRILDGRDDFVVKPAHGSGGSGILVVERRRGTRFERANGSLIDLDDLAYHVSNVLSGMYSLGGHPDAAMIEYRVRFDPLFEQVTFRGVPDIRTVVFCGVPVMCMVRLPTRQADGKANLHQGAVGVGVDLASGSTVWGVCMDRVVSEHPDTLHPIAGLCIPQWAELLQLAARCHELTGLGYLGVDVVLDEVRGPLVLELNARPGISIQIANRAGLRPRLDAVSAEIEARGGAEWSAPDRVKWAMDRFAAARPRAGG
ncbi:MAG: alpha-L-glutamate ligase-like protein [Myxococcota bacterium]|nr:alpha-L-glutamate ligase-like protein [Myxococcota bacterium]